MLYLLMTALVNGAATDEFAARMETLRFHAERLGAITVSTEFDSEKSTKLRELAGRLDAGASTVEELNAHYTAIDEVRQWLLAHSAERPRLPEGAFQEDEASWTVATPALTLRIARQDLSMSVTTPSCTWQYQACGAADVHQGGRAFGLASAATKKAEAFTTGYSVGCIIGLADFPEAPGFALHLCANITGNEIVFELAAQGEVDGLQTIEWPKPIIVENRETTLSVIPFMQGMLIPGNWTQDISQGDFCHSRSLYMPWWGQIQGGHGVQTIIETTYDGGAAYVHPAGGPTTIAPRWYATLGRVGYLRRIRYVFDDESSHVRMAKRYRRFVQENGDFVSLAEKRVRTPGLDEVIGRPVIHLGALYHFVPESGLFNRERIEANHALTTFMQLDQALRELKSSGIDDAYVHLDGWGFCGYDNAHPDVLPVGEEQGGWEGLRQFANTCEDLGYLFAVHDQYRDFYRNAVSFDERLALTRLDGSRPTDSTWCGGPQMFLNPRFAPDYVRRNHDVFAQNGVKVRGAYLDVFAVVPPEESAGGAHPVTRTECAEYRRDCFDLLRARGYVVSSEEPADYLVKSLDLVHHGPYGIRRGQGDGPTGIPAPLFNLVYHDSILLPWEMGEDGGWGIPKGDAGWLHCLLNTGLPYVGPGADEQAITRVKEASGLAAKCGLSEMTNHEFLDGNWRRQRTTFADGTAVTVNFDTKEYRVE